VTSHQEALVAQDIVLPLPNGAALTDIAVSANGSLKVADRVNLQQPAVIAGQLTNTGTAGTNIGASAIVGSVTSQGSVALRDRSQVNGFVKAGGTVTQQSGVVVTQGIQQNADLSPINNLLWQVTVPNAGASVNLEPDVRRSISPGSYGAVTVKSRAHLSLVTGTYYINSLSTEPQSMLELDTRNGPIIVYARSTLLFKGSNNFNGNDASVLWVALGTGQSDSESPFVGTIVAPNGSIRLAPVGLPGHRGSFFAHDVLIEAGSNVSLQPFKRWDLVFPVKPLIECTNRFDATHFDAVIGYDNPLPISVTVPAGPNNQFSPSGATSPPTVFLPGIHHNVSVVGFPAPSLAWSVMQRKVTADASTPHCTLDQLTSASTPNLPAEYADGSSRPGSVALSQLSGAFSGPQGFGALPPVFGVSQSGALTNGGNVGSSNGVGVIQQGANGAADEFTVTIDTMKIGNDALCWGGDPIVQVFVNDVKVGDQTIPTDCAFISACATTYFPNFTFTAPGVSANDASAKVRLVLLDSDSFFCGCTFPDTSCTETVIDKTFDVNNLKGAADTLNGDNWQLGFTIKGSGHPRVCATFNAEYLDAVNADSVAPGSTAPPGDDDYMAKKGLNQYPASNSVAQVTVKNGTKSFTYDGPLDQDGCVPADSAAPNEFWNFVPGAGANGLTVSVKWTSEFCLDPSGKGCINATTGKRTSGARFVLTAKGSAEPGLLCSIMTQDPSLTDPSGVCVVQHEADGVFGQFPGGFPPAKLTITSPRNDELTRVSAVVSNLYLREAETNGEVGLKLGLIDRRFGAGTNVISLIANDLCLLDDGTKDSCSSNGTIKFRPDQCCTSDDFTNCVDVPSGGCSQDAAGNVQHLVPGDSYWKFVVAHEIGHEIQGRIWGREHLDYGMGSGIAGAPVKCTCAHVTSSNVLHCLQSEELPDASQVEGFAQYFASRAYNRDTDPTCQFRYYKEFLDQACPPGVPAADCGAPRADGLRVSLPPIPFDCKNPIKWRNTNCAAGASPTDAVASLGIEMDWMGFYLAWNTRGTAKSTLAMIADSYVAACNGVQCNANNSIPFSTLQDGAASALGGRQSAAFTNFGNLAVAYGVSTDTAP